MTIPLELGSQALASAPAKAITLVKGFISNLILYILLAFVKASITFLKYPVCFYKFVKYAFSICPNNCSIFNGFISEIHIYTIRHGLYHFFGKFLLYECNAIKQWALMQNLQK